MNIKITNGQYKALRNNDDFKNLIRAGRALNAIAFGLKVLSTNKRMGTPIEERQARRAVLITAGFLQEARLLADNLKNIYTGKPYRSGLAKLQDDPVFAKERKLLRDVRNKISLHLDQDDESVKHILTEIESFGSNDTDKLDFYSSSDGSSNEFTFSFGDALDFEYSIRKAGEIFGKDSITDPVLRDEESQKALINTILTVSKATIEAYDEFIDGLSKELRIKVSL